VGAAVTVTTIRNRLAALEARGAPADGPLIIKIVLVGAKGGRPDGRRTDWNAHAPEVVVSGTPHPVGADETAHQAVERIVAAMRPQPHGFVALVEQDTQA
jgi:hypothetical protein